MLVLKVISNQYVLMVPLNLKLQNNYCLFKAIENGSHKIIMVYCYLSLFI